MTELDEYVVVPGLIREVEKRPALWDRTLADYKNKALVNSEWLDVCTALRYDFGDLEEKEKEEMMKFAVKKWTNVRDLWTKYHKKELDNPQRSKHKNKKPYVHYEACMFLNKVYGLGRSEATESANEDSALNGSSQSKTKPAKRKLKDRSSNKKGKEDTPEKIECKEESIHDNEIYLRCKRHISFFKGILPAISHLNENDTLEFQIGVLNVIKDLKTTQETTNPKITEVFMIPHQEVPVERMKREVSVESMGSSYNGEEEYLTEEFLDY